MDNENAKDETQQLPKDIRELGYEEARDQLFSIVQTLERNQSGLEESIALWERSELLARRCEQWLDGARVRLDRALEREQDVPEESSSQD